MALYVNCPECGGEHIEKVGFTWWGGVLGPAMLTHVRCKECRTTYNGKTGNSNTTGIIIYSIIVFIIALGLFYFVMTLKGRG